MEGSGLSLMLLLEGVLVLNQSLFYISSSLLQLLQFIRNNRVIGNQRVIMQMEAVRKWIIGMSLILLGQRREFYCVSQRHSRCEHYQEAKTFSTLWTIKQQQRLKYNNLDDFTHPNVLFYRPNNQSMNTKTSASARSKTPQRASSVLSEKRCKTNIFLNEKINQLINIRYLDSPMKKVNKILFVPQARYCSAVPPNQLPNNNKSALFDRNYRSSNNTFRQILRHNSSKQSKKRAFSLQQPLSQPKEMANHASASKNNSFSFKSVRTKMLQEYDIAQTVRKQIEQKFERTKMIFKEEAKMKKIQKMQQIYEKKMKISRKLNIDKQGNQGMFKSSDYQPWQKNRLKSYEESICETEEKQG